MIIVVYCFQDKYGPVGLIHVDAHKDTAEHMYGCEIAHGTPFFRAVAESCLDTKRVAQIGLRGSETSLDDLMWGVDKVRKTQFYGLAQHCTKSSALAMVLPVVLWILICGCHFVGASIYQLVPHFLFPGFPCGACPPLLAQVLGTPDGGGTTTDGWRPSVSVLWYRCPRSMLCSSHRLASFHVPCPDIHVI